MRRELSVGDTLSEVFAIYGAQAGVLLPVAFWLFLAVAIVDAVFAGKLAVFWIAVLFSLVVGTLYQGVVVGLVRDVHDGRRDSSVGELFGYATPVLLPLIGAGFLAGLGILAGFVLLVVPGLILLTIWAVIAPVIVIERSGVFEAFGRSRQLVRDNGWPVFWVVVIAYAISVVGAFVFGAIASSISDGVLVNAVFSALASTITAPIVALAAGVLYYRLLALRGSAPVGGTAV